MSKKTPDVMTLDEVADYLRIPRSTVYKLAREGRIPGQKIGRQWRFRRAFVVNGSGDTESQQRRKTQEQQG